MSRIRHEHEGVDVPREIRCALTRRWTSPRAAAKHLKMSEHTAEQMMRAGGRVRVDVLERVKAVLEEDIAS